MTLLKGTVTRLPDNYEVEGYPFVPVTAAFTCDGCLRIVSATVDVPEEEIQPSKRRDVGVLWSRMQHHLDNALWEPKRVHGKIIADVPRHIADPADEAHKCHSIGANRAAVLLARSVIEASAKEKGVVSGNLVAKIKQLADDGHVRDLLASAAHEVTLLGNDMAHGDFATADVAPDDAEDCLALMEDVLIELFALPTRVEQRKARREARKAI